MRSVATLKKQFDGWCLQRPIEPQASLADAGLILGAGTRLVRMEGDARSLPRLALETDEARLFALLSIAFRRPSSPEIFHHLKNASKYWSAGDRVLANIHLAFARLPRLENKDDAWRLHLAAGILDDGVSPRRLLAEIGYPPLSVGFKKFGPEQPRVPAGRGRASGQWTSQQSEDFADEGSGDKNAKGPTSIDASSVAAASATDATFSVGSLAENLFEGAAESSFLEGLAALGGAVVAGVALGAGFFPKPTGGTSEGAVPGDSELRYSVNLDEGILRFIHQGQTGSEIIADARLGRDGIFFETETGTPVARIVGNSIVFDPKSLASESEDTRSGTKANEASETDEPQLCPDPGPDVPHGASPRAEKYQAFISFINNPQRPLPPGMAVSLIDPETGERVTFDDCREADGTMIEAKGPAFSRMLQYSFFEEVFANKWIGQATRQVDAAGGRAIEWYFAEADAAAYARKVFQNEASLRQILVIHKAME